MISVTLKESTKQKEELYIFNRNKEKVNVNTRFNIEWLKPTLLEAINSIDNNDIESFIIKGYYYQKDNKWKKQN